MTNVTGDNNRITFRCFDPGPDAVVPPNYAISITPYQDMYVSAMFGNGDSRKQRAKAGETVVLKFNVSTSTDTQVTIYCANRIAALNDLSACYIAANNFSTATKLRKLVLGNTTPGYNNQRLVSLSLGVNKLLEELDIRNCSNLTGTLNLSQCSNLLKFYAEGTKLNGAIFATNGKVELIHLPNTINILTMRNLNRLEDFEGTLNRLETLTLQGGVLDNKSIVKNAMSTLRTLYLYDIDWQLPDTKLLNSIYGLYFSLLTGRVEISGKVGTRELTNYAQKWGDDLDVVPTGQIINQYLVTFVNYDGETILHQEWVDQGQAITDPIGTIIETPTRPSDKQYTYEFSGWENISGNVIAARTVTAQYTGTIRTYTVRWFERPGTSPLTWTENGEVKNSITQNYGTEVVYPGAIPTRTDEEDVYVFHVFTGWDKSTGFLDDNLDVYAQWDTSNSLPEPHTLEMHEMSISQLYGIGKKADNISSYFDIKDYYDITMGTDFNFSNVESQVLLENQYFDGTNVVDTNIKLFDENADSFTMAIDFEFTSNDGGRTLMSCYEETGSKGARLTYSNYPMIEWGDKSTTAGVSDKRGIVVLRHQKGSDSLFIYTSNVNNYQFDDAVTMQELKRSASQDTDSVVTFGAVKYLGDNGYGHYGIGWIHWCKIWFDDLGNHNCMELASWPHEKWRMEYYGNDCYKRADNTSVRSHLSFICNHALPYTYSISGNNYSNSSIRTLLNSRIFNCYPVEWRSIIMPVYIRSMDVNSTIITSEDYVYIPAYSEITNNSQSEESGNGKSVISIFNNGNGAAYCRFKNIIIPDGYRYFTTSDDPSMLSSNNIKEGDMWRTQYGSNQYAVYIYVSAQNAALHNYEDSSTSTLLANDGGLWVSASTWWLRTNWSTTSQNSYYYYINREGAAYNMRNGSYTEGIVHCISI